MIPLLSTEQIKQAEAAAVRAGTSESELMALAGSQIAESIVAEHENLARVLILCGPGKNGGDGIVAGARLKEYGCSVTVWAWKRAGAGDVPLDKTAIDSLDWIESGDGLRSVIGNADLVVDAVFGTGSRPELPEDVRHTFIAVAKERSRRYLPLWAVDNPSGVSTETGEADHETLKVDTTAVIGHPKAGLYCMPAAAHTGRLTLIDIGLESPVDIGDDAPRLITRLAARSHLPTRRAGVHKRSAGTVMVVGGAPGYYGAPRLSGEAALRSGAGLVTIAAPSSIIASIASAVPELTFLPLPVAEHSSAAARMASIVHERMRASDALVIGPGLGTDDPVPEFLSRLLGFNQTTRAAIGFGNQSDPEQPNPFSGRAVLDADALNWLSGQDEWWDHLQDAQLVLTPHSGELARLLEQSRDEIEADPWDSARRAATRFGHVVVLKYAHSVVATPDGRLFVANQSPPSLATAGTGDVLSGTIGAFLAAGLDCSAAAISAIALGLEAAATAEAHSGSIGILATDIIRELPAARESIDRTRTHFQ
ncbi:MAG: NAD(P)H-hydrate dehydratase [Thermomicrobiaceae bacterium]